MEVTNMKTNHGTNRIIIAAITLFAASTSGWAAIIDARDGIDIAGTGDIINMRLVDGTAPFPFLPQGLTNSGVRHYAISIAQLAGIDPQTGAIITDVADLMPFVGSSLQVVDENGNTVVGIDESGLNIWDPEAGAYSMIGVSNGTFTVDGSAASGGGSTDTDDQNLALTGTQLDIDDGDGVDLIGLASNANFVTTIANDSTFVTELSSNAEFTTNLAQDATFITELGDNTEFNSVVSNSVVTAGVDTDDQTLSFSGTTLSIADGNSVSLASLTNVLSEAQVDNMVTNNGFFMTDGSETMSGNLDAGGNTMTNVDTMVFADGGSISGDPVETGTVTVNGDLKLNGLLKVGDVTGWNGSIALGDVTLFYTNGILYNVVQ
jgi:hypothetical protein